MRLIALALITVAALPTLGRADLYTDSVLSLQWIVDSADGFHVVEVTKTNRFGRVLDIKPVEHIAKKTARPVKNATLPEPGTWMSRLLTSQTGDQWLLAVRGEKDNGRVFRGINLTRPTDHYASAAVLVKGRELEVLYTKDEILKAVRDRIELDHKIPLHADRELTDLAADNPSRMPPPALIGGFVVEVDCDFWDPRVDDPNGANRQLDTWICKAVVPHSFAGAKPTKDRIAAALKERHFTSPPPLTDDAKDFIGNWELTLDNVVVQLVIHPEQTYVAHVLAKEGKSLKPLSFFHNIGPGLATGVWDVSKRGLHLQLTSILNTSGRWSGPGSATLFRGAVTDIGAEHFKFDNGAELKRVERPFETYIFKQHGLWWTP